MSSVVKQFCIKAVKSETVVINGVKDMYEYLTSNHTIDIAEDIDLTKSHSFCIFFFLPTIHREDSELQTSPILDTRKLHCIQTTKVPGVLMTKRLTCFCPHCLTGGPGKCTAGTDEWDIYDMSIPKTKQPKKTTWPLPSSSNESGDAKSSAHSKQPAATSRGMMPSSTSEAKELME